MSSNQGYNEMPSAPTPGDGANQFNTFKGYVDAQMSGGAETFTVSYDSAGDAAVEAADILAAGSITLPAGAAGAFDVNFNADAKRTVIVMINSSGQTATLQYSGQPSPPTLATGESSILSLDGTTVRQVKFT